MRPPRLAFLFLVSFCVLPGIFSHHGSPAATVDLIGQGHEHYFNLEYDQAINAYESQLKETPGDPRIHNYLATAVLYKELNRLGMLETSAFKDDNQFLRGPKPEPDSNVKVTFDKYLLQGRKVAQSILDKAPRDAVALYSLSVNYGLHANYEFMVDKSYFEALRNGNKARNLSDKLTEQHPDFVDGYLVAGVQEYVVGSLPWAVRALVALGGVSGSKEKGEGYVSRVATEGKLARDQARVLLVLLHRREGRPLQAAETLQGLMADFPRNYILALELGAMYQDAGKPERALEVFRSARRKLKEKAPGYERMPQESRNALQRKIEKLEAELAKPATQPAGLSQ